jgi:outer membrane murein-binding lipoprotein Lpp
LQDSLKRKLATKESVVKMVEQEFKKNQALLSEKADKVSELEATVQKLEQEVERLTREVRLAKSSEASDEVVERLKKEKDELRYLKKEIFIGKLASVACLLSTKNSSSIF